MEDQCKGPGGRKAIERLLRRSGLRTSSYDDAFDVEIADVVRALNELPFVRATIYSCAGAGPSSRTGEEHGPENAYFMVSYCLENPDSRVFHEQMKRVAGASDRLEGYPGVPFVGSVRVYRAMGPNEFKHVENLREKYDDEDEIPEPLRSEAAVFTRHMNRHFWQQVRSLVGRFNGSIVSKRRR